jgi:HPt (histidine-containing phosphotransfer) domain-containing protein
MLPSNKPSSADAGFDLTTALARTGNDRELFGELVELVLAELPRMLGEIEAALAGPDWTRLRLFAHNLKGQLSAVSAGPVLEAAQQLESSARNPDLERARMSHAALLKGLERLRPALQEWLQENRS